MVKNVHVITIEEQCSWTAERETGHANVNNHKRPPLPIDYQNQPTNSTKERTSSWKDKLKEIIEAAKVNTAADTKKNEKPKIQRIPAMLQVEENNYKKYYEPRAVPIGPIHHGNPKLKLAETFKLRLVAKFIEESEQKGEALYKMIEDEIKELRDSYDEEVTKCYDDESLAWMLFLDGCSTLQFIHSLVNGNLDILKIKIDQVTFAQQDLFLLENQLPFRVLKLLIGSSKKRDAFKDSIKKFIQMNVMAPAKKTEKLIIDMDKKEPAHLLDLLLSALLHNPETHSQGKSRKNTGDNGKTFRNIQDLKMVGIQLRQSKSCSLGDITFSCHFFAGYLHLPQLLVDDSTRPKFLNLTAYEMCPDNLQTDYGITSYISFLDSLIDHAEDVKELRSAQILHNSLGSDEEVAMVFNEISTDLVPNPAMYKDVIAQIEKHYKKKLMTWMTQAYHNYFSNPWTIVAFFAAVIALALTGIQTWYAVNSPPGH